MKASWIRTPTALLVLVGLLGLLSTSGCACARRFGYSGIGRDGWQQPEQVMRALAVEPGATVADLGAGGGYFTWHLAEAVGEAGRVYAVDVDDDMLRFIEGESTKRGYANVAVVRAAFEDPKIPEPVSLIFSVNTYHHLQDREAYFERAKRYLRPGGRIAIIDHAPGKGFMSWLMGSHATSPEVIRQEMAGAGYVLEKDHDFLSRQTFLVFRSGG